MNSDSWSVVLSHLDVDSVLSFATVCEDLNKVFLSSLPDLCKSFDLHPCLRTKDFITAYAHSRRFWKRVKSFSTQEIFDIRFQQGKSCDVWKTFLERHIAVLSLKLPEALSALRENYPGYSDRIDLSQHTTNTTSTLKDDNWLKMNQHQIKELCRFCIISGSHTLLMKMYGYLCHMKAEIKRECFNLMIIYGVSPYYLNLCYDFGNLARLNGKQYLSTICANRNEYLLK